MRSLYAESQGTHVFLGNSEVNIPIALAGGAHPSSIRLSPTLHPAAGTLYVPGRAQGISASELRARLLAKVPILLLDVRLIPSCVRTQDVAVHDFGSRVVQSDHVF